MVVLKVDILVRPGTEEECKRIIRILQENSRKEPGCVQYAGHQSMDDPRKFLFYEVYKDDAALQAHRSAPYFKEHVQGGLDRIMESRNRELFRPIE